MPASEANLPCPRAQTEATPLHTRIPEGRTLYGLQYGRPVRGTCWRGYYVRVRDQGLDVWGIARETPAANELVGGDCPSCARSPRNSASEARGISGAPQRSGRRAFLVEHK
jgi:hypothetical protein